MAKKKGERAMNQELFDSAEFQEKFELAELAHKKKIADLLAPVDEKIAAQDKIIADAQAAIATLRKVKEKYTGAPARKSGGSSGKRERMSAEEIAILQGKIVAFVGSNKDGEGVSRADVAEAVGIKAAKAGTMLADLVEAKRIGTNGKKKAASRYLPA